MTDFFLNMTSSMPHWLSTIIISMIPVAELRGAIPVAVTVFNMNPVNALIISCIGNMIPIPFLILFVRPIFSWLKNFKIFKPIVLKLESKGASHRDKVLKYKFWGLFILVAIPLPGTGAWTGALVAAIMDLQLKRSLPAIAGGVVVAGLLVTAATTGVLKIIGL